MPGGRPGAEQPPHCYQLPQMIRIVIRDEKRFPKNRWPVAVGNRYKQIRRGVGYQILQGSQISAEGFQALFPSHRIRRRVPVRPVTIRERWRDVFWIPAEFEDVPLGDAHVFEEVPGGMRYAVRLRSTEPSGQVGDGGVEIEMRSTTSQQVEQVFPESLIVVHAWLTRVQCDLYNAAGKSFHGSGCIVWVVACP